MVAVNKKISYTQKIDNKNMSLYKVGGRDIVSALSPKPKRVTRKGFVDFFHSYFI